MSNQELRQATLEIVQLSEDAPTSAPGPQSWGGNHEGAEMVTYQQEDGWYGYIRGVNKEGNGYEGEDQGPFTSREEVEAELREQYEEDQK